MKREPDDITATAADAVNGRNKHRKLLPEGLEAQVSSIVPAKEKVAANGKTLDKTDYADGEVVPGIPLQPIKNEDYGLSALQDIDEPNAMTRIKETKGSARRKAEADRPDAPTQSMSTARNVTDILDVKDCPKVKKSKRAEATISTADKMREASATSSASSTPASSCESSAADQEDECEQALLCICRRPYDDEMMMLACDHCDKWFHFLCLKIDDEERKLIATFICPHCEPLTEERTECRPKCALKECLNAVKYGSTLYCCDECGLVDLASRKANLNQSKCVIPLSNQERSMLPQIPSAKNMDGLMLWQNQQDKRKWLQYIFRANGLTVAEIDNLNLHLHEEVCELPEIELLSSVESRRAMIEGMKVKVHEMLKVIESRAMLLQLAVERAQDLDPLQDNEDSRSIDDERYECKSQTRRGEDGAAKIQPCCGYDERLDWDDVKFQAWCRTRKAKRILGNKCKLDGSLCHDVKDILEGQVAVCGHPWRKCKQHMRWSDSHAYDIGIDRDMQTDLLSSLKTEEQNLGKRAKELQGIIKDMIIKGQ